MTKLASISRLTLAEIAERPDLALLHRTLTVPLFDLVVNPITKKKEEKIPNLTPEELSLRRRYYRSRQTAPKRFGQRVQLQVEALNEAAAKRAIEDAFKEEKEEVEMTKEPNIPEWKRLLDGQEIEYIR